MKKRFLSMLLALCMTMTLLPTTALAVSDWDGTGTSADPYLISTAADLAHLAANVNAGTNYSGTYFKMTADIVLNDVSNLANWGTSAPANIWTPIGTFANRFKGTFDGNNKTVSGIYTNKNTDPDGKYQSLFGCTETGSISNLNVTSSYILGFAWVGGIVGANYSATITNCHNSATVIGAIDVGGVVGVNLSGAVSGCSNTGSVFASDHDAGGIIGSNSATVANCYNTGAVNGYNNIGGVVGCNAQATTANCYNTGAVNSTNGSAGGIVGDNRSYEGTYIYNCYNTGNVTGTNPGAVCGVFEFNSTAADCYWLSGSAASGYATNNGTVTNIYSFSVSGTSWTLANADSFNIGTTPVVAGGSLLTALNTWVSVTNSSTYNTWVEDTGSTNNGYPIFGTAYVPVYAPGAPTIGTASAGNGQASVSFTAPASNGGSTITGYTVTSNPGGKTGTGVGSPITVTGLTNGTAYTFTVTATNSVGTSSPSSASNSVTPKTVPGTPTIGTAIAGDTQASVSFTAPASNGGAAITGYTVTVSPADVAPVNGGGSPIVVTGLTNGQTYTFTVTASNIAGTGAASNASNSVTPKSTQTITFDNPGAQTFGTTPTLTATSDSLLTVTFTSSTTDVATITPGGTLTFLKAGTATINANQAGNASFSAATEVSRTFTVNAITPDAPTIGTATAGNAQATVSFTPPASNGSAAITGYTVTSNPGGITATGSASPITVTGLTNGTAYTFNVTATNVVGTSAASTASNSATPQAPAPSGGGSYTPPAMVTHIDNGGSTTGTNLSQLVSGGKTLTVDDNNKGAKLVFDTEALKGISGQTSGDIKVEMKDVTPAHQESLPGKQVFSLAVFSGSSAITNFGGAVTVTLPYTLKDGETAADVTVWYLASDSSMTEIPCTYDPATKLATFTVTHFSLYVVGVPWNNPFTDVRENDWFYSAVEFVSQNGMMKGIGGTDFSPNTTVTRGMLVTILWRLENEPATTKTISLTDVTDGKWYAKAVAWAAANNIVTGYAGKFNPDDALTREQLAAILYRYAAYKNYDVSATGSLSAYADKPSDWALSSVNWAVTKGLIKGSGDSLDPKGSATRAQTATILQRFIENTAK